MRIMKPLLERHDERRGEVHVEFVFRYHDRANHETDRRLDVDRLKRWDVPEQEPDTGLESDP